MKKDEDLFVLVGTQQSPIHIRKEQTYQIPKTVAFSDSWTNISGYFDGESEKRVFKVEEGSNIEIGPHTAQLIQIHFHQPSEHKIDERVFDAEMHFVHQIVGDSGERDVFEPSGLVVLGVTMSIQEGVSKEAIGLLELFFDMKIQDQKKFPEEISKQIPVLNDLFYYRGSLTSAPYTENVTWLLFKNSIAVSKEVVERIGDVEQETRPVQYLNRRFVLRNFD